MADRRWHRNMQGAAVCFALAASAYWMTGCQSDTQAVQSEDPAPKPEAGAARQSAAQPQLHYEPEFDFFYASFEDDEGSQQLETGSRLLFYEHDLVGALDHFLHAAPGDTQEQKLARAVGAGRAALTMGRWFVLVAQFTAEANLGYMRDLEESAARKLSQAPSEVERFAAGRSAVYLNRKSAALHHLEAVADPAAGPWKETAVSTAGIDPKLAHGSAPESIAKLGVDGAVESYRNLDWKTPTAGRLWDPYAFEAASWAYLQLAKSRLEEGAALGAELEKKLEPGVLAGIRSQLALTCFLSFDDACVAKLGPGKPGDVLDLLVKASADRVAGKPSELGPLGASSSSLQAGLLAAQLAEGSPLEERVQVAEEAIEWGMGELRSANARFWPATLQEAVRVSALLRQRQAVAATDQSERDAYLGSAIERMREVEPDVLASKNEPLYVMQLALALIQRSGCSDLALASGMLHEKLKQQHAELSGPIWILGGINTKNCAGDPSIPGGN